MCAAILYPTDLTDRQYELLEEFLPAPKSGPGMSGRPAVNLRQVINGILYVNKTGSQWRMLPKDFGNWNTVYHYFNDWRKAGIWERIMNALNKKERERQGRNPEPSAACADSQSVKTVTQGNQAGFDGGKKADGRRRHILTDTPGLIIAVFVAAANFGERRGLKELSADYSAEGAIRPRRIRADGGYGGVPLKEWMRRIKNACGIVLEIAEKEGKGFNSVKHRRAAERTFAWLDNFRRHS